jgi:hypothetical protein
MKREMLLRRKNMSAADLYCCQHIYLLQDPVSGNPSSTVVDIT